MQIAAAGWLMSRTANAAFKTSDACYLNVSYLMPAQ